MKKRGKSVTEKVRCCHVVALGADKKAKLPSSEQLKRYSVAAEPGRGSTRYSWQKTHPLAVQSVALSYRELQLPVRNGIEQLPWTVSEKLREKTGQQVASNFSTN